MGWSDTFGAGAVSPNVVAFREIALSADLELEWPVNAQTPDVVAAVLEVTPSTTGLDITMPPANEWSVGPVTMFGNVGASTYTILDQDGGTITTVAAGAWKFIILTDNSDAAGDWLAFTFGTGSSSSDAAALAGLGLLAITTTLNVNHPVTAYSADQTATTAWRAQTIVWEGGSGTFTFPDTLLNGFFAFVRNAGSGALTLGATDIDDDTTSVLNPTDSCVVVGRGSGVFYTVGLGRSAEFPITRLLLNVAGSSNVTLTDTQAANQLQEYTGTLTGNINVIVPTAVGVWYVTNGTSGAYTLTVKTTAGTGVAIEQGKRAIFYCDGTNVVDATPWRTPIANLPMGTFKFTGIGNGSALTDSAAFGQIVSGAGTYGTDSGAADAYVVTLPTSPGAYSDGQRFAFQPANSNTGTSTINFSGVGSLTMKRQTNVGIQNLVGGEIVAVGFCDCMIDASAGAIVMNPVRNEIVGSIFAYGGTTAPTGSVFAFGQAVGRTSEPYVAAFAALSTTWGVGDGATTYNLPDLRGRALFGRDDMGGSAANRITNGISGIVGTTLAAVGGNESLTGHTHTFSATSGSTDVPMTRLSNRLQGTGAAYTVATAGSSGDGVQTDSNSGHTHSVSGTSASTGAGSSQNMPPAAIANLCVKL